MSNTQDDERSDRPQRRAETGRESRERILDAAEKLFIEVGVEDATFAAIEREAKISRGSIPYHFKHKAGLLQAIVDRATIMSTVDEDGGHSLHEVIEQTNELLRRPQSAVLSVLSAESSRPSSESHERFREWHSTVRRAYTKTIESTGDFTIPDGISVEALSAVIFGAIIGLGQQWRLAPDLVDLDQALEALERLITIALTVE